VGHAYTLEVARSGGRQTLFGKRNRDTRCVATQSVANARVSSMPNGQQTVKARVASLKQSMSACLIWPKVLSEPGCDTTYTCTSTRHGTSLSSKLPVVREAAATRRTQTYTKRRQVIFRKQWGGEGRGGRKSFHVRVACYVHTAVACLQTCHGASG
jgi:hypothetical protein